MKKINQNASEKLKIRERERDREREKYVPKEKKLQCRIIGLSYEDTKENGEAVFKTKK